mmetsp:Transcript_9151/g.20174  ORF Transcript_9151/g.20174 Transcript_9151/m.20174 type:complete len:332 (+) Transcript_9151:1542-2537(+)
MLIRECQLLQHEVRLHRRLVHLADLHQRGGPQVLHHQVQNVRTHIGGLEVQLEERVVVVGLQCLPDFQRVRYSGVAHGFWLQRAHQMRQVRAACGVLLVPPQVHIVQHPIGRELHLATLQPRGVEVLELRLALVVLVHIVALEGHAGVRLVHVDGEVVLYVLHSEVLSHRLQLGAHVDIVHHALCPLLLNQLHSLAQHLLGPHHRGQRRLCQTQVFLLQLLANAHYLQAIWIKITRTVLLNHLLHLFHPLSHGRGLLEAVRAIQAHRCLFRGVQPIHAFEYVRRQGRAYLPRILILEARLALLVAGSIYSFRFFPLLPPLRPLSLCINLTA